MLVYPVGIPLLLVAQLWHEYIFVVVLGNGVVVELYNFEVYGSELVAIYPNVQAVAFHHLELMNVAVKVEFVKLRSVLWFMYKIKYRQT
jgi:hypothetical protein